MPADRIHANQTFYGTVQIVGALTVPSGSFDDADVAANAAIAASKLGHRFHAPFSQPNTAATSETKAFYVAMGAGTVLDVDCGSIAAAIGNSTVTIDVKKNGTTILSGVVTLERHGASPRSVATVREA